jgi:hypothetical protein
MKTLLKTTTILLLVLASFGLKSQSITLDTVSIPDPILLGGGSTISYTFTMTDSNYLSQINQQYYQLGMNVAIKDPQTGLLTVVNTTTDSFFVQSNQPITSNQSVNMDNVFNQSALAMNNGNIVVIWPVPPPAQLNNGIVVDTLEEPGVYITWDPLSTEYLWEGYEDVSLYPNPVKSLLNIQFGALSAKDLKSLTLQDISGKILTDVKLNSNRQLNLENLNAGVYFLHLDFGENRLKSFKLMIQ